MIFQAFRKLLTNPIISKIPKRSSDHEVFLARNNSASATITVRLTVSILLFLLPITVINTENIFV